MNILSLFTHRHFVPNQRQNNYLQLNDQAGLFYTMKVNGNHSYQANLFKARFLVNKGTKSGHMVSEVLRTNFMITYSAFLGLTNSHSLSL